MLGGLIVWAAHFVGVYALASIGDVVTYAEDRPWRLAVVAFSGLCLAAVLLLLARAVRELRGARPGGGADPAAKLVPELSALGSGIAVIAIAWQALPAIIGH